MWTLTALLTGFAASLHCLGMCGPLVLGLHGASRAGITGKLSYHLSRALAYALLGALVGGLGAGLALAGWQRGLSIGAGLLVLWMAARTSWVERLQVRISTGIGRKLLPGLQQARRLGGLPGQLLSGFVNGLLPCGMVYVALTASAATGNALQGALFMALFGVGTWPAMLLVSFGGEHIGPVLRRRLQPVLRTWLFALGILLLLRGFDLGIPYISPQLPDTVALEAESPSTCH